jgi:uncharacterized BrkB/YihY/UPF0761 family membrane protein
MTDEHRERTSSDIWNRVNQQSDAISEIARAQAASEANIASLASAVESGFATIQESLNRINEKDQRPVNYIGYLGGFLGLLALFGGYSALIVGPVLSQVSSNTAEIISNREALTERAFMLGAHEESIDWLKRLEDRHSREHKE